MKTLLLFIMLVSSSFFINQKLAAQSSITMQDILQTAMAKVVSLEEQDNKEVVNISSDLLVNTGKKTIWRYLDPSFKYNVVVMGDRRINKLKLTVYKRDNQDKDWKSVGEISATQPQLQLDPADFEEYEFTVSVDEFRPGDAAGHFALILYHQMPEGVNKQ